MKGTVINATDESKSYEYIIRGEDGNEYFAHFGDLRENEKILEKFGELTDGKFIQLQHSNRADLE